MTARVARAIQKRRCDRHERKFLPPEKTRFLLVHSAAVGERAENERREDEQHRARTNNRAREMYVGGVLSARGVFANVRTLRHFVLLLKG